MITTDALLRRDHHGDASLIEGAQESEVDGTLALRRGEAASSGLPPSFEPARGRRDPVTFDLFP